MTRPARSAVYEGLLEEAMDIAASRFPGVVYRPVSIDAAYAGLLARPDGTTLTRV